MKFRILLFLFSISLFFPFFSTAQSICNGSPLCISGYSTGTWDGPGITGQTGLCITPTVNGTYTCQTITMSGSAGPILTYTINLLDKPVLNVTTSGPLGCSTEYTFTASASIASGFIGSYLWSFGDGSTDTNFPGTTHSYTTSGNYSFNFKAISAAGCADSAMGPITVSTLPNLSFHTTSACHNALMQFVNTSTIPSPASITSYTWDLGNGTTTNAINPYTTYTATGIYTITLSGTSNSGCISALTQTLEIFQSPQVNFTYGNLCSGKPVIFTPSVSANSGSVTNYYWTNWPTSSTSSSTLSNPGFIFFGGYNYIALNTISEHGCFGSDTQLVFVNPSPIVNLMGNSSGLCSSTYSFSFINSINSGATYSLNFNGNSVAVLNDTTFTYPGPGSYTAYIVTTSTAGCVDTNYKSITILPPPVLNFSLSTTCIGSTFSITATAPSSSVTSHVWNFGDMLSGTNTSTLLSPTHTYTQASTYSLSLTLTNTLGCTTQSVIPISIYPKPLISVSSGSICIGQSFSINPTGASTYTYLTGAAVVTPTALSHYSVIGASAYGCLSTNTAISTVSVYATPTISANNGTICTGNSFTLSGNGAAVYSLINGTTAVNPTVTTSYTVYGTSAQGCLSSNSASVTISVNPVPTISVNSGTICAGKIFTIVPVSNGINAISGGTNMVSPTTSTFYTAIATNSFGCSSSAISNVNVLALPPLVVNSGSMCSGNVFTFSPTGATGYTYSSGTSTVNPLSNTDYTITGIGTNGCINTAVSSVTVYVTPTISVNSGSICSGKSFTMMPVGAASYSYSNGSSVITPMTSTFITVAGISPFGCSNLATSNITVYITPTITVNSSTLCQGRSFTLTPSGASIYVFSGGNAVVSPTSNIAYTVTGTSAQGCSANAISNMTVFVAPVISVNSGSICNGSSFTITPTGAGNYTYSGGNSIVTPSATTSYTVTGTNTLGCGNINNAVSTVTVGTVPVLHVLSTNSTMCAGETSTLLASGAASYTWTGHTPASFIFITPTVTTEYTVTGQSSTGCFQNMVYTQTVIICTGISKNKQEQSYLVIYPNPNNGEFTLRSNENLDLTIVNALGQTLRLVSLQEANSYLVHITELAEGLYFVVSQDGRSQFKQKIIVSH